MSKEILIQFLGFESKASTREYTFVVRESSTEPREFKIAIAQQAFSEHRARFQDGPDICTIKLRRELTTSDNHPAESHFDITDLELDDYYRKHTAPIRSWFNRKPVDE